MININRIGKSINGSYNNVNFSVPFTEDVWKKMNELEAKFNSASNVKELKPIYDEFEKLVQVDYKKMVEEHLPNIFVNKATGKFYLKTGAKISSIALPETLVERIKTSIDKGIDATPLIKMWTRFLRNPKLRKLDKEGQRTFSNRMFNYINTMVTNYELVNELVDKEGVSEAVAIERATTWDVKITQEGLLNTFKVSTEITHKYQLDKDGKKEKVDLYPTVPTIDPVTGVITYSDPVMPETVEERIFQPAVQGTGGDAFFCGDKEGHLIRVGQVHRLSSWDKVDTNDHRSCVKGLHVGGLRYIKGYQNTGTVTHNVFVDPMNVGAITDDGSGALRVIEYFVHSSYAGSNGSIYHSSKYAAMSDAKWAADRDEIIKTFGEFNAEIEKANQEYFEEIKAL